MKKLAYSIVAAVLVLTATINPAKADETRSVSGYNTITSSGPFNVHIKINGTESLKIEASADVTKEIETTVEGSKLQIKFKHHNWGNESYGKIDIYITAKSLLALANSGSGSMDVDGTVSGEDVNVILSGSGSISSSVKSGQLHATLSGSGSIHLTGSANDAKVLISGSGEVLGKGLTTGSASVTITGSGSAYFHADKTISARIVGSGNVIYSGSATVDSHTLGSGRVSKED
ncbi:head GIN domain-containing protein [Mucilaginibacter sp.]|uniref:head GIN domain-containing protein n=1 Tax=Mucilaginibacter sp. TaxID=1882438 RepID=UPI003D0B3B99